MAQKVVGIRWPGAVAALALSVIVTACLDPIGPRHDAASLELDSSDGSRIRLITSTDFSRAIDVDNQQIFLLRDADTTWVDVPFQQSYDLRETGRVYLRAMAVENPEASVTMRVRLDGELSFQRENVPLEGEGLQYYYTTN